MTPLGDSVSPPEALSPRLVLKGKTPTPPPPSGEDDELECALARSVEETRAPLLPQSAEEEEEMFQRDLAASELDDTPGLPQIRNLDGASCSGHKDAPIEID